jgi:hypothetical protein
MNSEERNTAMPQSPITRELVRNFPGLGAVDVEEMVIEGPHALVPACLYRRPRGGVTV